MVPKIEQVAKALLGSLVAENSAGFGVGSFSSSVYDTAWMAMVGKDAEGKRELVFPECFQYLLDSQQEDGSWESYAGNVDGLLNTLAAFLAIKKRCSTLAVVEEELETRCLNAEKALRRLLEDVDISTCDRVGLEIIIPSLLQQIEALGTKLSIKSGNQLEIQRSQKISRLGSKLYEKSQSTLAHSLESFAGSVNYNNVRHLKSSYGAMLASPSSTAAYLMFSTPWDTESEEYLRKVVDKCKSHGTRGGVPSAYPTTIFEITWVISILLESGFTPTELGVGSLSNLKGIISSTIAEEGGLVGFAFDCLPDADDTAMAISTLGLLGTHISVDKMLAVFETTTHFQTYKGERNASLSTNCNVCTCLLRRDDIYHHTKDAVKALLFVTKNWYEGKISDKWNTSEYYLLMLVVKSFVLFLSCWEDNKLDTSQVPERLIKAQVPTILFNILIQTMEQQESDGSWGHKHEVTAYAILTLAPFLKLPWIRSIKPELDHRLRKGKQYLNSSRAKWEFGEYLWIEKVTYACSNLSLAYCLAAVKVEVDDQGKSFGEKVASIPCIQGGKAQKFKAFISGTPMFSEESSWKLELLLCQAFQFLPELSRRRYAIFPRKNVGKDEYLKYIPFTWIACGHGDLALNMDSRWDMMLLSMFIYQTDEFMEAVVGKNLLGNLAWVKLVIHQHCSQDFGNTGRKRTYDEFQSNGKTPNGPHKLESDLSGKDKIETGANSVNFQARVEVENVLGRFIRHVQQHPKVQGSSEWLRVWLTRELEKFLLSHVTHMEDCTIFSSEKKESDSRPSDFKKVPSIYYDWARTTSSDTTSCPFAFVFYLCLLDNKDKASLADGLPRYLVQAACRHLATMCRQQNDFGSVERDRIEWNLNSLDFVEFSNVASGSGQGSDGVSIAKEELLRVAEYEHRCFKSALSQLDQLVDPGVMRSIRIYFSVTNLYGQLYIIKDVSPYKTVTEV